MKGELLLEDVGGLTGRNKFLFESGKLNTIESPNASGKTTVIKGLSAILSLPAEDGLAFEVARKLGLRSRNEGGPEPLVNVNSPAATISLTTGEDSRMLTVRRTGEISNRPPGNERFLLTSLLTRESEIPRALTEGNGNFEWIVKEMSRARLYEKERGAVERWSTSNELRLQQLGTKEKEVDEYESEIRDLKKKIDTLTPQKNRIEGDLAKRPAKDPKTEAQYRKLLEKSRELATVREGVRKDVETAERNLTGFTHEMETINREHDRWQKKVVELKSQLDAIADPDELKSWEKEASDIEQNKIPPLNSKMDKVRGLLDFYELALAQAGNRSELKCILCEDGTLRTTKLQTEIRNRKQEISKIQEERTRLIQKKNEKISMVSEAKKRKTELDDQRKSAESQERPLKNQLSNKKSLQEKAQQVFGLRKKELAKVESELEEVEREKKRIEKEIEKLGTEESNLTEKLGRLRGEIESSTAEIDKLSKTIVESGTENIDGYPLSLDQARKVMLEWSETLQKVKEHLDGKIYEQKRGAAKQFNSKIKELMKRLGFSEFQEIRMDEETYEMKIIRKGGKLQPIASLSASEKYAIATLLQIAVKEAYMSEMPFFVVDEVVLDFDRDRVKGVLAYLSETAAERDWFVVVARIGETKDLTIKHG